MTSWPVSGAIWPVGVGQLVGLQVVRVLGSGGAICRRRQERTVVVEAVVVGEGGDVGLEAERGDC